MFYWCYNLIILDLSSFKLENLINSKFMFDHCTKLKEIKFNENTKTINLEVINSMFSDCSE